MYRPLEEGCSLVELVRGRAFDDVHKPGRGNPHHPSTDGRYCWGEGHGRLQSAQRLGLTRHETLKALCLAPPSRVVRWGVKGQKEAKLTLAPWLCNRQGS